MKRFGFMLVIVIMLLFTIEASNVTAHSGRTDGNGCHTCYTNCEYYGLDYGEYHCHNQPNRNLHNSNNYSGTQENIGQDSFWGIVIIFALGFCFKSLLDSVLSNGKKQ